MTIEQFAAVVEEAQRLRFLDQGYNLEYHNFKVNIKPGRKYTKVDVGGSGKYMVTADGEIFGIKAYGVIHLGHHYGTLDTVDDWDWSGFTAVKRTVQV